MDFRNSDGADSFTDTVAWLKSMVEKSQGHSQSFNKQLSRVRHCAGAEDTGHTVSQLPALMEFAFQ